MKPDTTNRWSHAVTHRPPATFQAKGTYTRSAEAMYLEMRNPRVSPNGLGSAIQMQIFFVNRAGRKLPEERKAAINLSVDYLRIELAHLKAVDRPPNFANEEKVEELLQNEVAYALLVKEFQLQKLPKPVYPPPASKDRIGGRNGYNYRP